MLVRDPQRLYVHDYLMRYSIVPFIPSFITPNVVTVFRMMMTPVVLWFLSLENFAVGVPLFWFVAFTDALDGSLARLRQQITPWGTFYDPLADKVFIGAVVLLVVVKHINIYFGLLIVLIEAAIILGALRKRRQGKMMSANFFGKTKMFLQVLGVTFLLLALWGGFDLFIPLSIGTLSLGIVFAVISLLTYGL